MASSTIDRRLGLVGNTAIKAPVDCATTANITLSGEQTIDGVLTSSSRVLVKDQSTTTQNGIYDSSSGAWTRALDFNGNYDITTGTIVGIAGGAQAGVFYKVDTANPITVGTSAITFSVSVAAGNLAAQLASTASVGYGDGLVGAKRTASNAEAETLHAWVERRTIYAGEFIPAAVNQTTTNVATYINNALLAVEAAGGGTVVLGPGRYAISATVKIPDGCALRGQGRHSTELYLLNSSNCNLIEKKTADSGLRAGLFHLALNGNDANNTSGGLYWVGASSGRGPSILIEGVLINYCSPATGSSVNGAVVLEGSTWGVMRDCDINLNQEAVGLWHKGSDWLFDGVYLGPNGATIVGQNVIIQGGAGNLFQTCYFGGNGGLEQVLFWGTQRNLLIGCLNDNAWQAAYRFAAFGGVEASNNMIIGGQISHAGGQTNNTYDAVSLEDAATGNIFANLQWIGDGHTSTGFKSRYAVAESGTATGNQVIGGWTGNNYGTRFKNLTATGSSVVRDVLGFTIPGPSADRGDANQTLTVGTDAEVQLWATTLTGNKTVTLSTTGAVKGDKFRVVRTGLGAFTLDVGGLKTIASGTAAFVDVMFNGSAWILTGYGAL